MKHMAKTEDAATYRVTSTRSTDDDIITRALVILAGRLKVTSCAFESPEDVKAYCRLHLGDLDHEVFGVLFLNSQNNLIEFREMFRGSLSQTSVYPREVVKAALELNAGSVIFTHNHPSGSITPSRADEALTHTLKAALALIDVRVLDHIIVTANDALSMAERGLV